MANTTAKNKTNNTAATAAAARKKASVEATSNSRFSASGSLPNKSNNELVKNAKNSAIKIITNSINSALATKNYTKIQKELRDPTNATPALQRHVYNYLVGKILSDNKDTFAIVIPLLEALPEMAKYVSPITRSTLLHEASRKAVMPIIFKLIELGADINAIDGNNNSPLYMSKNDELNLVYIALGATYETPFRTTELINSTLGPKIVASQDMMASRPPIIIDLMYSTIKSFLNQNTTIESYNRIIDQLITIYPVLNTPDSRQHLRNYFKDLVTMPATQVAVKKLLIDICTESVLDKLTPKDLLPDTCDLGRIINVYNLIPESYKNHPSNKLDLTITDEFGRTQLHYAAVIRNELLVRTLVSLNADINAKDMNNKTPFDYIAYTPDNVDTPKDIKDAMNDVDYYTEDRYTNPDLIKRLEIMLTPSSSSAPLYKEPIEHILPKNNLGAAAVQAQGLAGGRRKTYKRKLRRNRKTRSKKRRSVKS
jgi:hypothetical protein